jgi:small-conductance mechanosensitive channel
MADIPVLTSFLGQNWEAIEAVAVTLLFFALARITNYILSHQIIKLTSRTKTNLDNLLVNALNMPITLGFVLAGLYIGITSISYLLPYATTINDVFIFIEVYFTAFVAARILNTLLTWYAKESAMRTHTKIDDHMLPALRKMIYLLAFIIATLFFMSKLGVEVTTGVAALGVGGLAIGLALQDTLSNFFAGAYTTIEKPIKVGDFIQLETGETGHVLEIGWRSTRIRKLDNNVLIIPNNKLSQNRIINYDMLESNMAVGLACGVAYDSDLEKVEKVAIEVAKSVMKEHAGINDFEKYKPSVRFNEFGDSNIKFNLWFNVTKATDQYMVKHEMIKALKKRFEKEWIEISYPVTKVLLEKGKRTGRKK